MEIHNSRGRDISQNRNFRQNSGQNRQFREAGGFQTGELRVTAHIQNSDRDRSFDDAATRHMEGKKILVNSHSLLRYIYKKSISFFLTGACIHFQSLLLQYIMENASFFIQVENRASRGSRGSGRYQSDYPHQNSNFRQNSGQNRQRREAGGPQSAAPTAAAHVQNSGRGRSFRDPAIPHSAAPRANGGDGWTGSGGVGRVGRGGAHYAARQSSSEPAPTTGPLATMGASGRASRPMNNSCSITLRGSSTTTVAPNHYGWSHHSSALFSWRMGPAVCGVLQYVLTIGIIFLLLFIVLFNEIGNPPKLMQVQREPMPFIGLLEQIG